MLLQRLAWAPLLIVPQKMLGQLDWDGVVLPINDVTWSNVLATAERLQGLDVTEGFFVTYKDEEGDVINVKNEMDLAEAIRWAEEQGVPCLCMHVPFSSAESDSDESWTEVDNGSPRTGKVEAPVPEFAELDESEKRPMDDEAADESENRATPERGSETEEVEHYEAPAESEENFVEDAEQEEPPETEETHESPVVEHCRLDVPEIVPDANDEPAPVEEALEERGVVTVTVTPIPEMFEMEKHVSAQAIGIDRLIEVMCSVNDLNAAKEVDDNTFFLNLFAVPGNVDKLVAFLNHTSVRQAIATVAQSELASAGSAQKASTTQLIKMLYQAPDVLSLINAIPDLEQVLLRVLRALKSSDVAPTSKATPVPGPKILHAHVTCDGCGSDDTLLAASVAAGCRNEQGEILGVRYKSVALVDFDLCETCEATGRFQQKAGPFLKVVDPATAPDVISYGYEQVRRDPAPEATTTQSEGAKASEEEPAVRAKPEWRCKHWLKTFKTAHGGFTCDVCTVRQPVDALLHGCRTCNFDVCHPCFIANNGECLNSSSAQNTEVPKVTLPTPPQPVVATPAAPQAKFVSDVTLTDGCAVRPGERLNKTWRVRNSGAERWLPGTRICHVGGDAFGGPLEGVEVPLAAPGEAVNITVPLMMPNQPGRYTSYWRLMTPHPQNAKFGHRFWVTVNVLPPAAPVFVPPPPPPFLSAPMFRPVPPPPPPTQLIGSPAVIARPMAPPPPMPAVRREAVEIRPEYVEAVEQIVSFGFADIDKIATVLNAVNGDVAAAVERLLEDA